jgi:hypothetical protein
MAFKMPLLHKVVITFESDRNVSAMYPEPGASVSSEDLLFTPTKHELFSHLDCYARYRSLGTHTNSSCLPSIVFQASRILKIWQLKLAPISTRSDPGDALE